MVGTILGIVLALVLHVAPGQKIDEALQQAREAYDRRGETTTIRIAPGTYQEELTIDVPGLRLVNASEHPSLGLQNHGVDADKEAVRITWYYGHGYQYRSMGDTPNYGGRRTRRWNATVLVTAADFYAEGIIFENSFNLYVSQMEAQDELVDISQSDLEWTEKERPQKTMPERPREVGSTEVQKKQYRERAAAISFTETAKRAHLRNCRATGRQDVLYGDQGRMRDHQVYVQRLGGRLAQRFHDRKTERDIRHKHAVHHVHVDPLRRRAVQLFHLILEMAEIGTQYARSDNHLSGDVSGSYACCSSTRCRYRKR